MNFMAVMCENLLKFICFAFAGIFSFHGHCGCIFDAKEELHCRTSSDAFARDSRVQTEFGIFATVGHLGQPTA